jgi:CHAD domain-containing protein
MPTTASYTFDPETLNALDQALKRAFGHTRQTDEHVSFDLLDTFDGRLNNADAILTKTKNRYTLESLETSKPIAGLSVSRRVSFRFAWEFPDSPLARELEVLIKMRALLPVTRIQRIRRIMGLLNSDQKTVARATIDLYNLAEDGRESVGACQLLAIKGYPKAFEVAHDAIADICRPARQSPITTLLTRNDIVLNSYNKQLNLAIDPRQSAAEAMRLILIRLLTIMQANQAGIIEDIDTEFLHDFRVAARKSRSLLSQIKGVFKPEIGSKLQGHLKTLGRMTNDLRDLDVYLLKKPYYTNLLPPILKPGLVPLFRSIQRRRRTAYQQLCRTMTTPEFEQALEAIDAITGRDAAQLSRHNGDGQLILPVAQKVIGKTFRKLIKKGRRITNKSPDEALHNLRIDCKKMRYLLEFFAPLFPAKTIGALIGKLKKLQTVLGDFNDLSVQQDFLIVHLEAMRGSGASGGMHAAATGGLITRLHHLQQQLRGHYFAAFDQFDTPKVHRKFDTICNVVLEDNVT